MQIIVFPICHIHVNTSKASFVTQDVSVNTNLAYETAVNENKITTTLIVLCAFSYMRRNNINIDVLQLLFLIAFGRVARFIVVSDVFAAVYFFEIFYRTLSLFYLLQKRWTRPAQEVVELINVGSIKR